MALAQYEDWIGDRASVAILLRGALLRPGRFFHSVTPQADAKLLSRKQAALWKLN